MKWKQKKKPVNRNPKHLLLNYTDKLHEMDLLDGYNIHHKTEEVLQGLGFSNAHLSKTLPGIQWWLAHACSAGKNDSSET